MKVLFESDTPDGMPLRELAEKRARFALRRLTWLVPKVKVSLSDVNGPRGGVDKRCRIEMRTYRAGDVLVTALARDWRTALENALMRAARVLVRQWRRSHEQDRARLRTLSLAH
ncbi:MAG TPA: HPF/RaiA family ribosome-associated protein [Casimicrobiaceae bacterium]|nr:HPF/RaiA family ribosome-associated protein [Casimicrobiaceae bacterium]